MAGVRQTWDLDDFGAGIDLRDGLWSRNQARLRELRNCRVTKGRKLRRRPPCVQDAITLDEKCQGLVAVDGAYYTFAKKGDTIIHTGANAGLVSTLYFDNPDLCTDWELGEFQVFDGYAVAWILHTFPSTAYPTIAMFHVWDELVYAPTYVQDPYLPGSFSPSIADLTDQRYDADFRPVLGQGTSKLWTSTLRGNAHASRTADARVWNQRTLAGLKEDGEQYCFVVPEGSGVLRRFIVPRDATTLKADAKWAYYVLEKAVGTAWVPLEEVNVTPTTGDTWQAVSVASRFAGGWNEIAVDVMWNEAAAGLVRLRLVSGAPGVEIVGTAPTVSTTSLGGGTWSVQVTAAKYRHRGGDAVNVAAFTIGNVTEGRSYLVAVSADETNHPSLVDVTASFPNGWGCEHRAWYKRIDVPAGGPPALSDYLYAFESDQDNAWYTNLIAEYVDLAGAEDALSISTASHDNTGGRISSIASVRNRMLVTYAGSMQLWSIDQDTNRTAYLDQLQFGTDSQEAPSPVPFYGSIMVPTAAGFRSISVVGANTDNLQDTNVGEPVATLSELAVSHAAFWPWFGQYVVAGVRDGGLVFQVLDYSREAKITAWSLWTIDGMTSVDAGTMVADGSKLRWRSGRSIYHFDAKATLYRDFDDVEGAAYESFARLHYNDMGKPGLSKRYVSFDLVQDGSCTIGFELPPFGAWGVTDGPQLEGPNVAGTTYGRARLPISLTGPAIAPTFSTRDEAGWELQRVAIDFLLLRR